MNEMQVFENKMFGQLRTVEQNGQTWFVAADVCRALEIEPTATRRLDEDEKNTLRLTQGTSGNPNVNVVNEPGLYTLVLGSRKPEARAFKRWLTHEVLPAIRKHRLYLMDELVRNSDELSKALTQYMEENMALKARNSELIDKNVELKASNSDLIDKNDKLSADNAYLEKRNDELFGGYHTACREAARNERILNRYREQEDADGLCDLRTTAGNLCMMEHEFINRCLQRRLLYRGARGRLRVYARPFARWMFIMKGNRIYTNAQGRERLAIALNV